MKKVKVGFQKGDQVKIRGGVDHIYTIVEKDKWMVKLGYTDKDNKIHFAGWSDVSLLIQA